MSSAYRLAESIRLEEHGVHVLLWDELDDLYRAVLILEADLADTTKQCLRITGDTDGVAILRQLLENRAASSNNESDGTADEVEADTNDEFGVGIDEPTDTPVVRHPLLILFVPQAVSDTVGPWLNGWRRPLCASPGTLLVIRYADFKTFQSAAPDLASFVGPRIHNASTMISVIPRRLVECISTKVSPELHSILEHLPGQIPPEGDIATWIERLVVVDG